MRQPLTHTFSGTTEPAARRANGNATVLRALKIIAERAEGTRAQVLAHHNKMQHRWVGTETVRLYQRHVAEQLRHPAPRNAPPPTPEMFTRQAQHNVRARLHIRLSQVASIKTRMSNAVTRSLEPQPLVRSFNRAAEQNPTNINKRRIKR